MCPALECKILPPLTWRYLGQPPPDFTVSAGPSSFINSSSWLGIKVIIRLCHDWCMSKFSTMLLLQVVARATQGFKMLPIVVR
eukprot:12752848-Prorocentrum_lima.AAC.1